MTTNTTRRLGFVAKTETEGVSDFNPEVGFVPRTSVRYTKVHLEPDPRPDRWGIRQLSPMVNYTYYTDQTSRKVSTRWHFMNRTTFQGGDQLNIWYNYYFERLDNDVELPLGSFDVDLASLRVDFALSPTMTLRSIGRYNSR